MVFRKTILKSNNKLYIIKNISNIIFNNEPKFKSNSKLIMHLANKGKIKNTGFTLSNHTIKQCKK